MRLVFAVGVALVLSSGCDGSSPPPAPADPAPVGQVRSAIEGGQATDSHSYSVAICAGDSPFDCTFRCSATLIAANLVLTVRHCLFKAPSKAVDCAKDEFEQVPLYAPGRIWVGTNHNLAEDRSRRWHRAFDIQAPAPRPVCGADLAVILLEEIVPPHEAVPAIPQLSPRGPLSGRITAVGYGESRPFASDFGIRRARDGIDVLCVAGDANRACTSDLGQVFTEQEFVAEGGGCEGDSGSGAFDQEAYLTERSKYPTGVPMIGVLARGDAQLAGVGCKRSVYSRVDKWGPWLARRGKQAAEHGKYIASAWTNSVVADAEDGPLFAPRSLGAKCVTNTDCDSKLCASGDTGFTFACTQTCSTSDSALSCPVDFACRMFAQGEERCFYAPSTQPGPPASLLAGGGCTSRIAGGARSLQAPTGAIAVASALALLPILRRRRAHLARRQLVNHRNSNVEI